MKSELADVLDDKGETTGKVLPIEEIHEKELWHGVAHIWVYNKHGQMLMQHRSSTVKWGADQWDLAGGGHISAAETPQQAALRELYEELGLKLNEEKLKAAGKTYAENTSSPRGKRHKAWEWNYIAQMDVDLAEVKLQEAESQGVKWIDLDQLEAELEDEATYQNYAPRNTSLYYLVIKEIRNSLNK